MYKEGKILGIGGIFFLSQETEKTKQWYADNCGMKTDQYGAPFEFRISSDPSVKGMLQWSPFAKDTDHFDPKIQEFMINYRVQNIENLVEKMKSNGVVICDEISTYEYGKFVHIIDGDGRKVELWEPVHGGFDGYYKEEDVNKE